MCAGMMNIAEKTSSANVTCQERIATWQHMLVTLTSQSECKPSFHNVGLQPDNFEL